MKASAIIEWELNPGTDTPIEDASRYLKDILPEELSFHTIKVKENKSSQGMIVIGVLKPEEVLPYVGLSKHEFNVGGKKYMVKMNGQRYILFNKNRKCVSCGLSGEFFFLETHRIDHAPHFNLYGEHNGNMVLMTKDHTIPLSRGGANKISNYQTYCSTCNNLKSDFIMSVKAVSELRAAYDENLKNKMNRKQIASFIAETRLKMIKEYPV